MSCLNIVHIGQADDQAEVDHIIALRRAGHSVYIPGKHMYEQLMRRIMDANEIHVWDNSLVFELGMVYFYSIHALHYKLSWNIKVFCEPDESLPVFTQAELGLDDDC